MNLTQWRRHTEGFLRKNNLEGADQTALREFLVQLYESLLAAPHAVRVQYDSIEEGDLEARTRYWADLLSSGQALPTTDMNLPLKEIMTELGGLLRACDMVIRKEASHFGPEASINSWRVGSWYLIPRKRIPHWRAPKYAHSLQRRGMLHHRLLPTTVSGLDVVPVAFGTISDNPGDPRLQACAAMLSDFKLDLTEPDGKSFRAIGTNEAEHVTQVIEQLRASAEENCFNIVWPELTVPPFLRETIRTFADDNIVTEALPLPDIIVTGSWHEDIEGKVYNTCFVFDRFGREVIRHHKIVPYFDRDHGDEDIEPGNKIHVIVTDDFLVSIAICKDFCGYSSPPLPFLDLNTDFIIVPSMGDDTTLASHQRVAEIVKVQNGGRAFVVQQSLPAKEKEIAGYVIPPDAGRGDPAIAVPNDGGARIFNRL